MVDEREERPDASARTRNVRFRATPGSGTGVAERAFTGDGGVGAVVCHPGFAIELLDEGEGEVSSAGRVTRMAPGTYLLRPEEVLVVRSRFQRTTRSRTLWFLPDTVPNFDALFPVEAESASVHRCTSPGLRAAAERLVTATETESYGAALAEFMAALPDCVERGCFTADSLSSEAPFTLRARRHLATDLHRSMSLDEVAAAAGASKFYFLRRFKSVIGLPPGAYRLQVRLARARRLLQEGLLPADVAAATGFADQSHFTRHFGRMFGVTPGRYRQIFEAAAAPGEHGEPHR